MVELCAAVTISSLIKPIALCRNISFQEAVCALNKQRLYITCDVICMGFRQLESEIKLGLVALPSLAVTARHTLAYTAYKPAHVIALHVTCPRPLR